MNQQLSKPAFMRLALSCFGKRSVCYANRYKVNNHYEIKYSAAAKVCFTWGFF